MKQLTLPLFRKETENMHAQMRTLSKKQVVTTTLTPLEASLLVQEVDNYFAERRYK